MVQIWESAAAIEAALGEGWKDTPTLPEEARGFIERVWFEHYEVADRYLADS